MLDIEAAVISYLSENLDCKAYASVPNPRPERFVTVERTGGRSEEQSAIDFPTVAVQSWDTTRLRAQRLASEVDALMAAMPFEVTNVMHSERNSLYSFPDPDSEQARYQGVYDLVTT